jgi:AcrR family transcriptional regulator
VPRPTPHSARRHPAEGGYARGEQTRARIIAAALKVFAEEGYTRASTRRMAAVAGVNLPALQYYFNNKEGLHLACGQAMAARVAGEYSEIMTLADEVASTGDAERATAVLCDLLDRMLTLSAADDGPSDESRFLARAQANSAGPAYSLIRGEIIRPLFETCATLTAAAIGPGAAVETSRLITLLLMNQLSAVSVHRDNTLSGMDWTGIGPEETAALRKALRLTVSATLKAARAQRNADDLID